MRMRALTTAGALSLVAMLLGGPMAQESQESDGGAYRLQPGDTLAVSVWNEEALQRQVVVLPDGQIGFPLAGEVQAGGRTVGELREELTERLSRFIGDPVVSVSVLEPSGHKVYVIGQVARPGAFAVTRRVDVMQALSMAGGTTRFAALNQIRILRRGENGKMQAISFRYSDVEDGERLEQNILLEAGDVVVVP